MRSIAGWRRAREAIRRAEAEAAEKAAQEEAIRREATIMAEAWKAAGIAGPGTSVVNVTIHEVDGEVTELQEDGALAKSGAATARMPDIHVHMPDEIKITPTPTETVAERGADDRVQPGAVAPAGEDPDRLAHPPSVPCRSNGTFALLLAFVKF